MCVRGGMQSLISEKTLSVFVGADLLQSEIEPLRGLLAEFFLLYSCLFYLRHESLQHWNM